MYGQSSPPRLTARSVAARIVPGADGLHDITGEIRSVDQEILPVLLIRCGGETAFARAGRRSAATSFTVRARLVETGASFTAQLVFELLSQGAYPTSASCQLALGPEELPELTASLPDTGATSTGAVFSFASCRSGVDSAQCGLLAVAVDDVVASHGRWRIKEALAPALSGPLEFLASGQQLGRLPWEVPWGERRPGNL